MFPWREKKQTAHEKALEEWKNYCLTLAYMDQEILGIEVGTDVTNGIELWEEELALSMDHYINRHTGEIDFVSQSGWHNPLVWILCDGGALLVKDEPDLFVLIGYRYGGSGDYFRVPDFGTRGT